jgi:hypothetical protein
MDRTLLHTFSEINLLMSKAVLTLGAKFGEFRSFTIALKPETDAFCICRNDQHVRLKARIDLVLLYLAFGSPLQCVTVREVIARAEIIAPDGSFGCPLPNSRTWHGPSLCKQVTYQNKGCHNSDCGNGRYELSWAGQAPPCEYEGKQRTNLTNYEL